VLTALTRTMCGKDPTPTPLTNTGSEEVNSTHSLPYNEMTVSG